MKTNRKVATAAVGTLVLTVLVAATGTAANAATLITGKDIKDQSISAWDLGAGSVGTSELKDGAVGSVDLQDGSIKRVDLSRDAKNYIASQAGKDGATGAQGPKGDTGARGPKGDTGAQGLDGKDAELTFEDFKTPANPDLWNFNVVSVKPSPLNGTADVKQEVLSFDLEEGLYRLDIAAQVLYMAPSGADVEDYGVFTMTVDGEPLGSTIWTGDIPSKSNAAQTSGWSHLEVGPEGAHVVISGALRGASTDAGFGAFATATKIG
jgi:hypothetical protein